MRYGSHRSRKHWSNGSQRSWVKCCNCRVGATQATEAKIATRAGVTLGAVGLGAVEAVGVTEYGITLRAHGPGYLGAREAGVTLGATGLGAIGSTGAVGAKEVGARARSHGSH